MDLVHPFSEYLGTIGLAPWVIEVFVVVFATLLAAFLLKGVFDRVERVLIKTPTVWDQSLFSAIRLPVRAMVWVVGIAFAIQIIQSETGAAIFDAVEPLRDVTIVGLIAWFLVRFIRTVEENLIEEKKQREESFDRATYDAIAKLLRLSVVITAVLVALQTLGYSIAGVLAFGGIGGIAVGFAAKDLLANFFGGLMIYLDRPFAVGDWIRSPDRDIEGTVERIGWRLTVIRTFNQRPLYVPNSVFTSISVQNPSRMSNREIYEVIGVRYEDADKMCAIVGDVKAMLDTHPEIEHDKICMVAFNTFASSSLDFFIYCYTTTTQWAFFHDVKQDVLLRTLAIVHAHGADVAFPTSTVHLAQGEAIADPRPLYTRGIE